jgi:hypothetical protein
MKSNDIMRQISWYFMAWSIAILLQNLTGYVISNLLAQYVITDDRIIAWTTSNSGPISSLSFMVKLGEFEKQIFSILRSGQFVGICLGLFFLFRIGNKKTSTNFWIIFAVCFLGLLGVGGLTGWMDAFILLAECVPVCGWATLKFGNPPELKSGDFHNMGGEYYRGNQLVRGDKTYKVFDKLSLKEGAGGINLFPGHAFVYRRETEGLLVLGSPGSGKTQLIHHWTEEVYKRPKDKAIIWDTKGLFTQSFMNRPGVDLLAAWDKRSIIWSPGEDIKDPLDAQRMAEYLIPRRQYESQEHFPKGL